jgi:hypothetical protein
LWYQERRERRFLETLHTGSDTVFVKTASARADIPTPIAEVARRSGGKVIASVAMRVPARDTVIVHSTVPTNTTVDSVRQATFRDSTFAGVVEGLIIAPPCCAPLELTYRIHRPEFEPSVGFVRTGSRVSAVVAWRGEQVELETPFAAKTGERLVQAWLQGVRGLDQSTAVSLGVSTRPIKGFRATAYFEQRFQRDGPAIAQLNYGLRYTF